MQKSCCIRTIVSLFATLVIISGSFLAAAEEKAEPGVSKETKDALTRENVPADKQSPDPANKMTGEELLNLATELKLTSEGSADFSKVIALCQQAEEKGLSEENKVFCHELKISTQMQRGLMIAQLFMLEEHSLEDLPRNWKIYRTLALADLEAGGKESDAVAAVQLALGRLYMLPDGDKEKALDRLERAIKLAEDNPLIRVHALKYRAELEENPLQIIAYLEQAQKLSPSNSEILGLLAQQWVKNKEYAKGLKIIDQALANDPDNKSLKKTKALALAGLGKKAEAEKLYNEATFNANEIMDQVERAEFLSSIDKRKEAIALFSNLLTKFQVPGLYYFRAVLYSQDKNYKAALNDLNQALRIDANFSEAVLLKGVIYIQQGKYDEAIKLFETLVSQKPKDASLIVQLAYAHAKKGSVDRAVELVKKALTEAPKDPDLLRNLGDIYLMYGRWSEAIETYEKLLAENPDDSGVLNNFSWLLSTSPDDKVRNGKKALEYGMKAAELTLYKEAHILSTLAAAYAENGNFDKALEWSKKAVELAEKDKNERLEDLRAETKNYEVKKPWREIPEKLRNNKEKDSAPAVLKKPTNDVKSENNAKP